MFQVTRVGNEVAPGIRLARRFQSDPDTGLPPRVIFWGYQIFVWTLGEFEICDLESGSVVRTFRISQVRFRR